ncbi:hypothetical protein M0813_09130 [Anaeramoeba flamelloides]|uniref:Tetratricopeptide repeat protein n=1 Tax=Anaeramoeba flamelloides TaxID=1746091 RepID=A0AAV7YCP4_9EUKA|nr:hypothetical protein M0812_28784 [Anaeramoeba flamelloides]KAJ6228301.1 hypothetical protein M0813_09130 [Anaeramoeba flamelloides]
MSELLKFKSITDSLNSVFRTKTKRAEAIRLYEELKKEFDLKGDNLYSALCSLAISRCEHAKKDYLKEAMTLREAGLNFWRSKFSNKVDLSYPTVSEESTEAISCFLQAAELYLQMNKKIKAMKLYNELAICLKLIGEPREAAFYFRKAAALIQSKNKLSFIQIILESFYCLIDCTDYSKATNTLFYVINFLKRSLTEKNSVAFGLQKYLFEAQLNLLLLNLLQRKISDSKEVLKEINELIQTNFWSESEHTIPANDFSEILSEIVNFVKEREIEELEILAAEIRTELPKESNRIMDLLTQSLKRFLL